jgi:hypothetical protein
MRRETNLLRAIKPNGVSSQEAFMHENIFVPAFSAGLVVAVVFITTMLVVRIVRYVVLILATCAISAIYLHGGISELVAYASDAQTEMISKLTFSAGGIVGVLLVMLVGLRTRRKSAVE